MDINEFITVYGSFSSYCKIAKRYIGPKQDMKKEFEWSLKAVTVIQWAVL